MGVVYEAEDLILKRHVAIKFLPDDLAPDAIALERFQREAQAASALNHPNICVIHEIGQQNGRPFIVMEFMKGKTLKHTLSGKPMEIKKIAELGMQIADALESAHAEKIIHRDIKPANIFITERGQAKLLDFGLAKKIERRSTSDSESPTQSFHPQLTHSGAAIGTIAYMSPEQARGKDLDARTDLFSLGCVIYEMATGTLPFGGDSVAEIMEAILGKNPVPPVRINPKVPIKLEEIISKSLEKDPNLRYQTASEIRTDLQRLLRDDTKHSASPTAARIQTPPKTFNAIKWLSLAAAVIALAFLIGYQIKNRKSEVITTNPSIAVLPFVNMTSDKSQEYFSDGLSEELLNKLSKIPQLRVTGRTSSFAFKGKSEDLRTIGQKLNVKTILEGSVRKEGSHVRITAQLVNVSDGFHIWSDTYDRELNDIFAIQDDIARSVADELQLTLFGKLPPTKKTNQEAYNSYLQGRYFVNRLNPENLEKALHYYEDAIKFDPDYAPAWAGAAHIHALQANYGISPIHETYRKAKMEVEKALKLDDRSAWAYSVQAFIQAYYDWDWSGAEKSVKQAMDLEPNNPQSLSAAALLASAQGQNEKVIVLVKRAIELDPLYVAAYRYLGNSLTYLGRLDEAETAYKKILELAPDRVATRKDLSRVYLLQSKLQQALFEVEKERDPIYRFYGRALVYHALGKEKEANEAMTNLIQQSENTASFQIAEVYAYWGQSDKAFEWLEHAYQQRDSGLLSLKGDPFFRKIETDPRYSAFLTKMHLK